jgi:hypothetical protein
MNFFTRKRSLNRSSLKVFLLLLLFVPSYFLAEAQSQARPMLSVQLLLNTNEGSENTADGAVALFDDRFSYLIGDEDSYKLTNPDENLAINCRGTLLSIDGQPGIHGSDTLLLKMWTFRQKSYYLQLTGSNFNAGVKAVIKDNYLGTETLVDLSSVTLLHFNISTDQASFANDRFSILFKTKRTLPAGSASKIKSAFKENSSLSVFPDTSASNAISLRMSKMKKGKYMVSLYNNQEEIVYSGIISYNGNNAEKTIIAECRIRKGTYTFMLTYKDVTIKKSLVFE